MTLRQVEILLVEDSSADAEMTMRTLKRRGIANHIVWVRDGVEALEYLFCEGEYADRASGDPKLVMLDRAPTLGVNAALRLVNAVLAAVAPTGRLAIGTVHTLLLMKSANT